MRSILGRALRLVPDGGTLGVAEMMGEHLGNRLAVRIYQRHMAGLLAILLPATATGQSPPDLNALVIEWARGHYASPVLCEVAGNTIRGIRRILVTPETSARRERVTAVRFIDMQVDDASRCFNTVGQSIPNVVGVVRMRLPGRPHPETAARDFKLAIRRDRGFEFEIVDGALRLDVVGTTPASTRTVDFRGGRAWLRVVFPATDAARELAEFRSPRKVLLELQAKDTTRLSFPIFIAAPR